MKTRLIPLVAALALLALPAATQAHVEISPKRAPAAKPVTFTFEVGHGCDGAATSRLVALMPSGAVTASRPLPVDGWKASAKGDRIVWTGGPLGDHDHGEFPFKATLAGEKGDELAFKVIQQCVGGAETGWIQTGDAAGELENPAPVVRLTSSGDVLGAADDSGQVGSASAKSENSGAAEKDDGGSSPLRVIGLVLIVAAVTAFVVRLRARRQG